MDFYTYWQRQVELNHLKVKRVCIIPTTHGMANKVFGLISMIIYAMVGGKFAEICNWPAFTDYFTMKGALPIREVQVSQSEIIRYENGCKMWPELKEMTLSKLEEGDMIYVRSNCRMLYTFYGLQTWRDRFLEYGIDLSFDNPIGSEEYIYNLFFKKIIGPSKAVQEVVSSFTKDWDQYCVLGIHIRAGDQAFNNQEVYKSWLKKSEIVINAARQIERKCKKPFKWFIISDYQPVKDHFINLYHKKILTYNSTIVHTGWTGHKKATKGVMDAINEIYMYSKCDYRFYFYGTTYGYWGSVIAGKNSIILTQSSGKMTYLAQV